MDVKKYRADYYLANKDKIKAQTAAWQAANPERVAAYRKANQDQARRLRRKRTLMKYGLSAEQADEALAKTQCAICKVGFSEFVRGAAVDHDHTTGKFRDLLCPNCNLGLGYFEEDKGKLQFAIEYLGKHKR